MFLFEHCQHGLLSVIIRCVQYFLGLMLLLFFGLQGFDIKSVLSNVINFIFLSTTVVQ